MKRVLFINGHVWQSQRQRQVPASWVLISQPEDVKNASGEIVALGDGDAPAEHREGADVVDLKGAIMLPGLQDSHIHIGCMGESAHYVELSGCHSVAGVQETVRRHAEDNPDLPWLIGTGWDQNLWSPAKALTRLDLDACLPDGRPCLLYRRCWHAAVVNSAALRAADINPDKPWSPVTNEANDNDKDVVKNDFAPPPFSPSGGGKGEPEAVDAGADRGTDNAREVGDGVEVDGAGRPTGLFREGSMRLVEGAITTPSFEIRCEQFAEALERCVRSGLTAVHSNDENAIQIYARLQEEGRLPIRVYLTLPHEELEKESSPAGESGIGGGDGGRGNGGDDDDGGGGSSGGDGDNDTAGMGGGKPEPWSGDKGLVSWNRVKLFSDGSLGAETAAMRLPYLNTDNKGVLIHEPAALTRKVAQARDRGFRVEVHAIGDRALANVLDAFEGAGLTIEDRPIVTHCQVAGPDLVTRMGNHGAIAAVQPSFVPSDAAVVKKRLSPSVHASCYPWRSLLSGGVTCAGSSDAPIETHDPFRGIYDAVFRPDRHASSAMASSPSDAGDKNSVPSSLGEEAVREETKNNSVVDGGDSCSEVSSFLPHERLTLEEAVWMYTAGGAVAAGAEDRLGAIRPGFLADLTVVQVQEGGEKLLENPSLVLRARVSQVWVGGHCRWDKVNNDSRIGPLDSTGKHETEATSSQGPSSPSLLSGSGMPGKNGPKRKRTRSSSDRNGSSSNPWLSGGIGRMGRCRCCS